MFAVKAREGETDALKPINRGFLVAGTLTLIGTLLVALLYVGNDYDNAGWKCFGAVAIGLVLAQLISRLTEYYTGTHYRPVKDIAESAETGPATVVLAGTASGLESSVYAVIAIAIAIGVALSIGGGNLQFSFYLVALTGMGMLATTGVIVSEDTFGPVSDNAAGIAEMSGEFHGEAERIMVSLDAVGQHHQGGHQGLRHRLGGHRRRRPVRQLHRDRRRRDPVGRARSPSCSRPARGVFDEIFINVADPKVFIGLLIGGAVPFLFSSLAIRAVGRTAGVVVQEVRKQFADGKIMRGEKEPEYGPVIDICTEASLRELATPALLAVLTPVVVGFGINFYALGAFLAAVILVGQLMANYLSNAGGAWDNAKKYIEDGHHGGKGSDAHKAAVIGDTVGDPFKDTAGPALNPLIKVMNLVSLLILPAIISLQDNDGARYAIAAGALVVLVGAIVYSSRQTSTITAPATPSDRNASFGRRPGAAAPGLRRFAGSLGRRDCCPVRHRALAREGRPRPPRADRVRRERAADRLLPAGRLAAVRRRVPVVRRRRQPAARAADHRRRRVRRRRRWAIRSATCSARRSGPSLFDRPQSRLFNPANLAKANAFFERRGPAAIVLARFVPDRAHVHPDRRRRGRA